MTSGESAFPQYPCDDCGHLGMAHTARRCIEMTCMCDEFRSYAENAAEIGRLYAKLQAVFEYLPTVEAVTGRAMLAPIYAEVALSARNINATDVRRGQEIYEHLNEENI